MTKSWLRLAELLALVSVAGGLIGLAAYMVYMDKLGEAFGAVVATIPLVVQAIRNIGAAQAMNAMAEYLANSTPVPPGGEALPVAVVNQPDAPVPVETQG